MFAQRKTKSIYYDVNRYSRNENTTSITNFENDKKKKRQFFTIRRELKKILYFQKRYTLKAKIQESICLAKQIQEDFDTV